MYGGGIGVNYVLAIHSLDQVLQLLTDTEGMDARGLEDLIYRKSGLLGVSGGVSSDMRTLRA